MRACITFLPVALVLSAFSATAQVVPDKKTATAVTTSSSGRATVAIAPANASGISHNTYTEFSVTSVGVGLNNRGVDATTIVNEVTSTRRSLLQGPLEVLGSRAHVVVANPNGITIDGGQFINTGGVALSGGRVRFEPGANGILNTVLPTGAGSILVTGSGLAGAMTTLQLIAGRIKIDGHITNTHVSPNADIALVAGNSEVTLDSSISPLVTLRPLASRRDLSGRTNDILVDVMPKGALSASRISVAVSARGAGVSYAGSGQAAIGDFHIDANGKVTTKGAAIKAEKSIRISAADIEILNRPGRQSTLSSITSAVTLVAKSGAITLHGAITGAERDEEDSASLGGVTLNAKKRIELLSESADRLAIAFSSKDDLYVQSEGSLVNNTGRLLSNATTIIRAKGILSNTTDRGQPAAALSHTKRPQSGLMGRLFGLKRKVAVQSFRTGSTRIPGQLGYIAGEAVDIQAQRVENAGEIDALDGSLIIEAKDVANTGFYSGSLNLTKNCGTVCWSRGTSDITVLGGKINAAGSLDISAKGKVENTGEIVAYGNLSVTAKTVTGRALFAPAFANRPAGFYNLFTGSMALFSLSPIGGSFLAPSGKVIIDSENPLLLSGGTASGQVATEVLAGIAQIQADQPRFPGGLHHIGLFQSWLK